MRNSLLFLFIPLTLAAQSAGTPPRVLPAMAATQLAKSLDSARPQKAQVWRDTPPVNPDGTINGYIEVPLGEKRKYEFDMTTNSRRIDRVMPDTLGGYPINYGYVPQTVSYDGDPFDILVLGPALPGGRFVKGVAVGVMHMEDEKGLDSKVVVSPVDAHGKPLYSLTSADQKRVGDYFAKYKLHEPGKFSKVPGWGSAEEGIAFVRTTHAFFKECASAKGDCKLR
jgi:inorganic pyrophosphatase